MRLAKRLGAVAALITASAAFVLSMGVGATWGQTAEPAGPAVALAAADPSKAHSGKSTRHHRLNRGGDRQANCALWTIVFTRMSNHPPTRDYVARRTKEGLSKPEIIRCLKRYAARELFPHVQAIIDSTPIPMNTDFAA